MTHSTIESVLLDNSFYEWYLQTDTTAVNRWNEWRAASDNNRQLLDQAVYTLHGLMGACDPEGNPLHVHAVHIRLQKAREKAGLPQQEITFPPNKAEIPDQHIDACSMGQ